MSADQVVFGSAPGVPNWGALLQRASNGMADDDQRHFDTLFVVDPARTWYHGVFSLCRGQDPYSNASL